MPSVNQAWDWSTTIEAEQGHTTNRAIHRRFISRSSKPGRVVPERSEKTLSLGCDEVLEAAIYFFESPRAGEAVLIRLNLGTGEHVL
jgi:hypothetical protein